MWENSGLERKKMRMGKLYEAINLKPVFETIVKVWDKYISFKYKVDQCIIPIF